ncbi:hypothetical protein [Desulfoluna spongiiphila]|uniref:4-hydroxy 2-oxovalerate aldolase n=1 Tax=Desulfoluna spongiiphila TaxID=419481 RepID=A0A1G5BNN0_9BACT|nr:hypothetical protein [Desulfoluna spongiiphila]SCX91667.1 4-hydroxy 2-oxovalerate aldolase [Desulfoluna spongiiphila]VVS93829.1 aldolase-type tim barrel [Desulfoluna spongiiphila]
MREKIEQNLIRSTGEIKLLDSTLRDGSYAVDFQFDKAFVVDLAKKLNDVSVGLVEIAHGIGFEAERAGHKECNISLTEWCDIANANFTSSKWGMFAQPKFSRLSTLSWLCSEGMSFVRVGLEAYRVEENLDYVESALQQCDDVYLNLMKSSVVPHTKLRDFLRNVPSEVAGVYIVDSYGTMLPEDVENYVRAVKEIFPVVGFHGHNNLGMANANSLAAISAGASIVDGTLHGIGRGSGNAAIESLAGILSNMGKGTYDYREFAKLAEMCNRNMKVIPGSHYLQVLGGVIGLHTSLFPVIEKVCSEQMIDEMAVMKEALNVATYDPKESDIYKASEIVSQQVYA